jgi:hypothetical protein
MRGLMKKERRSIAGSEIGSNNRKMDTNDLTNIVMGTPNIVSKVDKIPQNAWKFG